MEGSAVFGVVLHHEGFTRRDVALQVVARSCNPGGVAEGAVVAQTRRFIAFVLQEEVAVPDAQFRGTTPVNRSIPN